MIIAGPCSFVNLEQAEDIYKTADMLMGIADYFRCKVFLGGTKISKYFQGVGEYGIPILEEINKEIPTGIEIQLPEHYIHAKKLAYYWIGARNCQNYGLYEKLFRLDANSGMVFIKRHFGMTIEETIGIFDILNIRFDFKNLYIIERGVNIFDRTEDVRWSIQINDLLKIKYSRPEIFERLIIDCSHSAGKKEFVKDIYLACKAIGIKNFMFECTHDGKSLTDQNHIITCEELCSIVKD